MKKISIILSIFCLFFLVGCTAPDNSSHVQNSSNDFQSEAQIAPSPVSQSLQNSTQSSGDSSGVAQTQASSQLVTSSIFPPLADAKSRILKKTFGLYITPKISPVQPERFTGYHTGVDFETFADEQNIDVPFYAICSGPLVLKETASGYGGVAVQQCTLHGEAVTVIYGHIRLSSVQVTKGEEIAAGQQLGLLGTGYSQETDGERKHLHLGIHKGTAVNILGYVQNKAELEGWVDGEGLLQ